MASNMDLELSKDPVLPPSSGTSLKGCVCGCPSCNGAEAYEHLVNKPRTDDPDFRRAPVMMPSSGTFLEYSFPTNTTLHPPPKPPRKFPALAPLLPA
ncbi:hypothetical protein CRE_18236 [Caenorhabditis remanei]|uniref:Uncharacterized protein n=1 Tax=Caenorhabditis remanei TaxID=31234 RepID=E3NFI3_CAERE|nr:hypothetical protein CRE_18236 [Caenorhabditis remanei]